MAKKRIKDLIEDMAKDFLAENQLELYNVEFLKEGKDWFLRVYIDKAPECEQEYVGSDDCELVSRFLSAKLDEEDPIEQNYYLEVSSPGLDRQLLTPYHYERYAGKLVEVKLYKAVDGCKLYEGVLQGLRDGNLVITVEDKEVIFPMDQVAKTNLAVVF